MKKKRNVLVFEGIGISSCKDDFGVVELLQVELID